VRPASDREAWLVLAAAAGVGPRTAGALVHAAGGSPRAAVAFPRQAARASPVLSGPRGERIVRAVLEARPGAIEAAAEAAGLAVLTPADEGYPASLRASPDGPAALFVRGLLPPDDAPRAAVVGTRAAGPYGLRVARTLSESLARAGVVVVSGLARGVDAAAHAGALAGGGLTVAVLGCGADVVYPPEHGDLAREVAAHGALVSEHPPGTPPHPGHFPRRNRIVAALSGVVVVVEAPVQSGALGTARLALDANREVLAVPGPVDRGTLAGCHRLIQDGAKLCEGPADVIRALGLDVPEGPGALPAAAGARRPRPRPAGDAGVVLGALDRDEAFDADDLVARTGLSPDALAAALTLLEVDGLAVRVPGAGFLRA
jgi:DNA processing protein